MRTDLKVIACAFLVALAFGLCYGSYVAIASNWMINAGPVTLFFCGISIATLLYFIIRGFIYIIKQ